VSQFFALNVGFTQDELTAVYDPDIRARGWAPEPLDLAPDTVNGKQAALYCCKEFDGVPSFLSVVEGYIGSVDLRADVGVTPTPDARRVAGGGRHRSQDHRYSRDPLCERLIADRGRDLRCGSVAGPGLFFADHSPLGMARSGRLCALAGRCWHASPCLIADFHVCWPA
jgi:hypothetical protein